MTCATGTHRVADLCVADVRCGPGTVLDGGACVASLICAAGTHADGGVCLPDVACGPGTFASGGACVPDDDCPSGTFPDGGACLPDQLGGSSVRLSSLQVPANGYAQVQVLALETLPDGTAAQEQALLRLTDPSRGTINPALVQLGALGANAWFTPCNAAAEPQCAGPTQIELVRVSAPAVVLARSAVLQVIAPPQVGSAAPCLDGGNALFLDGDPAELLHPGPELVSARWVPINLFPSTSPTVIDLQGTSDNGFIWDLIFSSRELGVPLVEQSYDDVQRAYFEAPGHPGLDVSGHGTGCSGIQGRFEIEDLQLDGGTLQSFTATFEQACDGETALLHGCLHYSQ